MERFNAEVFLKIAELGSYRKAADSLGYTQAGIKYIVDAMEEEAGLKFFAREYGGVSLTENGKDILPWNTIPACRPFSRITGSALKQASPQRMTMLLLLWQARV